MANRLDRQLLYGRFLSGDGNFHLVRRRNRAGTGKDGDAAAARRSSVLGDGAFWVPQAEFDQHIQNSKAQPKKRNTVSCLAFCVLFSPDILLSPAQGMQHHCWRPLQAISNCKCQK